MKTIPDVWELSRPQAADLVVKLAVAPGSGAGPRPAGASPSVLRPENITVRSEPAAVPNEFPGTVRVAAFLGDHLDCLVEVGDTLIRARAHPGTELRREQEVFVELPLRYCVALPDDGWRPRALSRSFEEDE